MEIREIKVKSRDGKLKKMKQNFKRKSTRKRQEVIKRQRQ